MKLERRQVCRPLTKTCTEAALFFKETTLSNVAFSTLKSIASALIAKFNDCQELDKQLRGIVLEEVNDEDQLDTFFNEVNDVTATNRGKMAKLEFFLSKFDKKCNTSPVLLSSTTQSALRSKLPEIQLPIFDGKITDWFGFWERFQSQLENYQTCPIRQNSHI